MESPSIAPRAGAGIPPFAACLLLVMITLGVYWSATTHGFVDYDDGDYVTGDIDDAYLERLSFNRNDLMKQRREADYSGDHSFIELHNHA